MKKRPSVGSGWQLNPDCEWALVYLIKNIFTVLRLFLLCCG